MDIEHYSLAKEAANRMRRDQVTRSQKTEDGDVMQEARVVYSLSEELNARQVVERETRETRKTREDERKNLK